MSLAVRIRNLLPEDEAENHKFLTVSRRIKRVIQALRSDHYYQGSYWGPGKSLLNDKSFKSRAPRLVKQRLLARFINYAVQRTRNKNLISLSIWSLSALIRYPSILGSLVLGYVLSPLLPPLVFRFEDERQLKR